MRINLSYKNIEIVMEHQVHFSQHSSPPVLVAPSTGSAGHQLQRDHERTPPELVDSVLRWVSLKELVFVFLACNVVAALLRDNDRLEFKPVWNQSLTTERYSNRKFPLREEKV